MTPPPLPATVTLTAEQWSCVYDLLVGLAGARDGDRTSFVLSLMDDTPTTEYRFCGSLGFGGKFRPERFAVDCYQEDVTPERAEIVYQTNAALARLRALLATIDMLTTRVEAAEGALAEARLACADLCRARADEYHKEGETLKGLEKVLVLSREAAALSCENAILTALRASGTREGE